MSIIQYYGPIEEIKRSEVTSDELLNIEPSDHNMRVIFDKVNELVNTVNELISATKELERATGEST